MNSSMELSPPRFLGKVISKAKGAKPKKGSRTRTAPVYFVIEFEDGLDEVYLEKQGNSDYYLKNNKIKKVRAK